MREGINCFVSTTNNTTHIFVFSLHQLNIITVYKKIKRLNKLIIVMCNENSCLVVTLCYSFENIDKTYLRLSQLDILSFSDYY